MTDLIRRTLEWLRLLFAPGTGKRRPPAASLLRPPHRRTPPLVPPAPEAHSPPLPARPRHPLDGTDSALVRPYLAAHEREAALQERRRLALVLAAGFGIDLDRHLVGAHEVAHEVAA